MRANESLHYHLPNVGTINAELFPLASECYRLLQDRGHIDRLRYMDQLGIIRQVYEGAHHSRWEYVMAQLSMVHALATETDDNGCKRALGFGLSSENTGITHEGNGVTGADIMQCWVLLLNAGHLDGTFATERALLRYFREGEHRSELRQAFLANSGLSREPVRDYCRQVLDEGRLYDFHKAITLFLLFRYTRKGQSLVETLVDVMLWYCLEDVEHEAKRTVLRRIFSRLRRLCYLALDSQYAPVPIVLDLGAVLFNFGDAVDELCSPTEGSLCRELDGFNDLLANEVYFDRSVVLHYETHVEATERQVTDFYNSTADRHFREITDLRDLIMELQTKANTVPPERYEKTLGLSLSPGVFFTPHVDSETANNTLKKTVRRRNVATAVVGDSRHDGLQVAIGIKHDASARDVAYAVGGLTRFMVEAIDKGLLATPDVDAAHIRDFIQLRIGMVSSFASDVVEIVLERISTETCGFAVDREISPVGFLGRGTPRVAAGLRTYVKEYKGEMSDSRIHEVETHIHALEEVSQRGCALSVFAPTLVTDEKTGRSVTDFDGITICTAANSLCLLIVEAKDLRTGSSRTASRQLVTRCKEAGLAAIIDGGDVSEISQMGAYLFASVP